jgi:MscS family membrane protein
MENFFSEIINILIIESWVLKIFAVILGAIILKFIVGYFLNQAQKLVKSTSNIWDDAVISAAKKPLASLIWVIAAKFSTEILLAQKFAKDDTLFISTLAKIAIIICISWFLLRLVNFASQAIKRSDKFINDEFHITTIDALTKLIKLVLFIITALVVLNNVGVSISGILAAGGAGGLVIGFAAKDLFANFFGGLTIYLDRPFNVGDWIRCDERSIEGAVEHIGWRHTRLRSFNKNPIYVPNAIFTTVVVENPSRMTHRRIKETIGIRYDDISKMKIITDEVREMIKNHEATDTTQTIIVNFTFFNSSSVDFFIYSFTKIVSWKEYAVIKQDILLKIAEIIAKNNAEIAFPTQTVHLDGPGPDISG